MSEEKDYYHFTKYDRAISISELGLVPRLEQNSHAVGDKKPKVSYSIGKIGAVGLFANFYSVYEDYKNGIRFPREDHPGEMEQYEEIMKSKSFEDYLDEGMYLVFDGTGIENTGGNRGEKNIYDASTDKEISPDKLKVCVVQNQDTGEVSCSKFDFIQYLMSTLSLEEKAQMPTKVQRFVDRYYKDHAHMIERFKNGKYEAQTIGIDEFCKKYEELIGEYIEKNEDVHNKSTKSTQALGSEVIPEMSDSEFIDETGSRIEEEMQEVAENKDAQVNL